MHRDPRLRASLGTMAHAFDARLDQTYVVRADGHAGCEYVRACTATRALPSAPPARHVVPSAMMAFDSRSTSERPRLSAQTLAGLRQAVLQLWTAPEAADGHLGHAMDALVREAREQALRAEDVLIEVKTLLQHLPQLDDPDRRMESARFREQLVTRCIKAYYGNG